LLNIDLLEDINIYFLCEYPFNMLIHVWSEWIYVYAMYVSNDMIRNYSDYFIIYSYLNAFSYYDMISFFNSLQCIVAHMMPWMSVLDTW